MGFMSCGWRAAPWLTEMLVLPAELTHVQDRACLDLLRKTAAAEREPQVVVDATALQRFDSSALAVLLSLRRSCQRHGKTLAMRGLAPRLRTLAGLYGVSGLLADEAPNAPDSA